MKKRVLYGAANYEEIVEKNGYFVDKTAYIKELETVDNPVFLRPRRFGKSLLCRILECYYNIRQKDDFQRLFGKTWIGKNPTPLHSSFLVLHLDFSVVEYRGSIEDIEKSFDLVCNSKIRTMIGMSNPWFPDNAQEFIITEKAAETFKRLIEYIEENKLPRLYLIIDEYDNFANQLIVLNKDELYRKLIADESFIKIFFKTIKEGRKTGAIANIFITGVLPITMDELASGFNIANFITLYPQFENMLGFTQSEVSLLLDEVYQDYEIEPSTRKEVEQIMKNQYNGYHFVKQDGEALYNPTILLYFLQYFTHNREIPEILTDMNLKTDLLWIRRITGANPQNTEEFVTKLTTDNIIEYDRSLLTTKFNTFQFFEKGFYPVSFFYLGMLTIHDKFYLKLPNLNMRQIFVEYFNEIHNIDVSTK
ncbi:MAG: AAA family ATPase, partial [Desulfamplus sp.]|nr:AAA family ATPase [Desulfamplus sp.]